MRWLRGVLTGPLQFSVAFAFHDHLIGIVCEPVDGALGEHGVLEQRDPFVNGAIAGEDGRGSAVAFQDDFVEVTGLLVIEAAQRKIVNDQQIGGEKPAKDLVGGVIGPGLMKLMQEPVGAQEQHLTARAAGRMAQGAGEEGFSDPHRTEEDDVFLALDKSQ